MRILLAALTIVVLSSLQARAGDANIVGAACWPAETNIASNGWVTTGGTVKNSASSTANQVFYCPITHPISAPSHVYLLYSSTENHADTYVKASYVKMNKGTGAITTVSTASSNSGTNNGTVQYVETTFSDTYDLSNYLYYVRVDLKARTTSQTVIFFQVTVW